MTNMENIENVVLLSWSLPKMTNIDKIEIPEAGYYWLADLIESLAKENGLSLKELAREMDIPQGTLYSWTKIYRVNNDIEKEEAKRTPGLENLAKIAKYWGKTPEYLVACLYQRQIDEDALDSFEVIQLLEMQNMINKKIQEKLLKDSN